MMDMGCVSKFLSFSAPLIAVTIKCRRLHAFLCTISSRSGSRQSFECFS